MTRIASPLLITLLAAVLLSCGEKEQPTLRLATTTSTRDSGLLDRLVPVFESANGCRVDVIAVGTGAALKLGERGDVDALLVHAEQAELRFMSAGYGVRREPVMFNGFLVAGPASDPAGIRGVSPAEALSRIAKGRHRFVSRGDDSGTHKRELALWGQAGGLARWDDYVETGRGMGATLVTAGEMGAYVLADEGTWIKLEEKLELVPLVDEGKELRNPYAAMVVDPARAGGDGELAQAFVDFLISKEAQLMIRDFEIRGRHLFRPLRLAN